MPMDAQSALVRLRGNEEERRELFSELLLSILTGEPLQEWQIPILETLRKEFLAPSQVISLSATVSAAGGMGA